MPILASVAFTDTRNELAVRDFGWGMFHALLLIVIREDVILSGGDTSSLSHIC